MKPFSESCAQNQDSILAVLRQVFSDRKIVLEIGSGTGQHAVYFGKNLPHLVWQTSDLQQNHEGILAWLNEENLPNVLPPLSIDVSDSIWPTDKVDALFSANSVHIMSWNCVEAMFRGMGRCLSPGGIVCFYGPFNYGGKFTSEGNEQFDRWLKANDARSGVRDFEALDQLARSIGLTLMLDLAMPANNRTLVWKRTLNQFNSLA